MGNTYKEYVAAQREDGLEPSTFETWAQHELESKLEFKTYDEAVRWVLDTSEYLAELAAEEVERMVSEGELTITEEA